MGHKSKKAKSKEAKSEMPQGVWIPILTTIGTLVGTLNNTTNPFWILGFVVSVAVLALRLRIDLGGSGHKKWQWLAWAVAIVGLLFGAWRYFDLIHSQSALAVKAATRRMGIPLEIGPPKTSMTFWVTWTNDLNQLRGAHGFPTGNGKGYGDSSGLAFPVTNPNEYDVGISDIEIEVKAFNGVHPRGRQLAGESVVRQYTCDLQPKPGFYKCIRTDGNNLAYIRLSHNEMERFTIRPTSKNPGVFKAAIWINYLVGTQKNTVMVGEVTNLPFFKDE